MRDLDVEALASIARQAGVAIMKRTFFPALILVVLSLVLPARTVVAETLVFPGKAYCGLKDDIHWPFKVDPAKAKKKQDFALAVSVQPAKSDAEKTAAELGSDMSGSKASRSRSTRSATRRT